MSMIFLMRPNVRRKRRLFGTRDAVNAVVLIATPVLSLQLDRAARLFELLLDGLGLGLRHALLDRLGRPVDQVLGLLEPEPRELAHDLDHLDLLVALPNDDDREVLLLACGPGRAAPPPGPLHPGRCRCPARSRRSATPCGLRARLACAGVAWPATGGRPGAAPAAPRARAASRAPLPRRPEAPAHRAARP